MAKKNCVHIVGYMGEIKEHSNGRLFFTVDIRKNDRKFVHPIIEIATDRYPNWQQLEKGKLIIVEGSIKTEYKETTIACPECHSELVDRYVFTTVLAQKLFILDTNEKEVYINRATLLGVVVKGQEFKYIQSTYSQVGNMKYQISINRNVPSRLRLADQPWICTFNVQAEQDAKRLQTGSQILVEGALNTRYVSKDLYCECGAVVPISEPQTEVLGNSVEYLDKCLFPENEQN